MNVTNVGRAPANTATEKDRGGLACDGDVFQALSFGTILKGSLAQRDGSDVLTFAETGTLGVQQKLPPTAAQLQTSSTNQSADAHLLATAPTWSAESEFQQHPTEVSSLDTTAAAMIDAPRSAQSSFKKIHEHSPIAGLQPETHQSYAVPRYMASSRAAEPTQPKPPYQVESTPPALPSSVDSTELSVTVELLAVGARIHVRLPPCEPAERQRLIDRAKMLANEYGLRDADVLIYEHAPHSIQPQKEDFHGR